MTTTDTNILDADELLHLALREANRDQNDKAIEHLKRAVEIQPDHGQAWYLLGAMHAEIGLYERAIEELQTAIELDATIPTASFQLGLLFITAGRIDEAEQAWQALDKLDEQDPLFRFKRGLLKLAENDYQACIDDLTVGMDLNTSNPNLNIDMQRIVDNTRGLQAEPIDDAASENKNLAGEQTLLSAYQRSQFDGDDK